MNAKDIGYLAGVAISLVMAGSSLKQQNDETKASSTRITNIDTETDTKVNRLQLELEGMKSELKAAKEDRDLLIRMDERLKNIERAVIKKRYQ